MKSREEILQEAVGIDCDCKSYGLTAEYTSARYLLLILEILLDIRDLLEQKKGK